MKELFHEIRHNLPSILKSTVIRLLIGGAIVAFLRQNSYQSLSNLCFFATLVFAYFSWRQFMGLQGVGTRFLTPGGYANSMVSDSNIRDNPYESQRQTVIDSSDWNLLIANLLVALVFAAVALVDYLL